MTYLTGKRCETDPEKIDGATEVQSGVIVSEPFRQRYKHGPGYTPMCTCVAVMWDAGIIEGAIDVELLKVLPKQKERAPDGNITTVKDIVLDYLSRNQLDGLFCKEGDYCECGMSDLMRCEMEGLEICEILRKKANTEE